MPRFRKKPIEILAEQLPFTIESNPQAWSRLAEWCGGQFTQDALGPCILINTLEGQMRADPGDWIIQEPLPTDDRQFYPCKPEIFAATYEEVTE